MLRPGTAAYRRAFSSGHARTLVQWAGSVTATGYQVKVGGRITCRTGARASSCAITRGLGPNALLWVRALGASGTASPWTRGRSVPVGRPVDLGTIHSPPNRAAITRRAGRQLRAAADLIAAQGFRHVILVGHTARAPGVDNPRFRQRLSKQRARAAKRVIGHRLDRLGARVRIRIVAADGRHPTAGNDTRTGRARNRRVVISLG